jgi:hypothetical protein
VPLSLLNCRRNHIVWLQSNHDSTTRQARLEAERGKRAGDNLAVFEAQQLRIGLLTRLSRDPASLPTAIVEAISIQSGLLGGHEAGGVSRTQTRQPAAAAAAASGGAGTCMPPTTPAPAQLDSECPPHSNSRSGALRPGQGSFMALLNADSDSRSGGLPPGQGSFMALLNEAASAMPFSPAPSLVTPPRGVAPSAPSPIPSTDNVEDWIMSVLV